MPLTTPSKIHRLRGSSSGPNRSGSMTAIGRAPMEKMSRRIPPTPVAAPWYGSTADGWLWLSMRMATAIPSPASITPAPSPSPGPTSTWGASPGRRARWTRDDLYEQCSLHITANIASSRWLGGRPRIGSMAAASSSVRPSSRCRFSTRPTLVTSHEGPSDRAFPSRALAFPGMPPAKKRAKAPMTARHKEALALGREQGRAVRGYLEALEAHKPKRGRKRTPESIERRLRDIETKLPAADPLSRLQLLQERMNLEQELAVKAAGVDIAALEDGFVEAG